MGSNDGSNDGNNFPVTCCNQEQSTFLSLYVASLATVLFLADAIVFKPARLLATAIHEFSHAAACWMTGGDVTSVKVFENEGGVTQYRGGWRCFIASAGYLGEAVCGMLALVCSGGRRTSTGAAIVLIISLILSLCHSPNRTLVILSVVYAVIIVGLVWIEWFVYTPVLPYVTLFGGVFLGCSAVRDIFSHLVIRNQPGSDAYALYEESGRCCSPRLVGCTWLLGAILLHFFGLWLALVLMRDECEDQGWFECLFNSRLELDLDWWPDDWSFGGP